MFGFFGLNSMSGFGLFGIMFPLIFFTILGVILVTVIKGILQWNKNNHSPRLTVPATVVTKRASVSGHVSTDVNEMHNSSTSTFYYVTFQFQSGDRMEFHISGREYGLLAEGDHGKLTFQGTRCLSFERE